MSLRYGGHCAVARTVLVIGGLAPLQLRLLQKKVQTDISDGTGLAAFSSLNPAHIIIIIIITCFIRCWQNAAKYNHEVGLIYIKVDKTIVIFPTYPLNSPSIHLL